MQDTFRGGEVPPEFKDFSGPLCEDPACWRKRPHFPREYGCRWSFNAICNKDGTTTIFKDEGGRVLTHPKTVRTWF